MSASVHSWLDHDPSVRIAPATAVGPDPWFASVTKCVGAVVHGNNQAVDLTVVGLLCLGSIPRALLTLALLEWSPHLKTNNAWISPLLGLVLLLTAAATFFRAMLHMAGQKLRLEAPISFNALQKPLTIVGGLTG